MEKRAALYVRVSTTEQEKHGSSLETQLADCRAYATQQGYTVALERSDVYSGRTMSRAGLEEVLDAARRSELDVVVCATIDRSNRELADLLMMDRELTQLGADLEFVKDPREKTPQGNLFFQIKGAFAEYEHAVIVERMRKGKMHVISQGRVMNGTHIAYGYRYDPSTQNLAIHEPEAAIVRELFEQVALHGSSMLAASYRLNERAVPTPGGGRMWREDTVSTILHNEVYAGRWSYNKRRSIRRPRKPVHPLDSADPTDIVHAKVERPRSEWLIVAVPPIVTEDLWQAANAQIRRNIALSPRNRKAEYLLAGLVRCGSCGCIMYGWRHGPPDQIRYYRCSVAARTLKYRDTHAPKCPIRAIRLSALENVVWAEVVRQLSDTEAIAAMMEDAETNDPRLAPTTQLRVQTVEREYTQAQKEAERLLDLYLAGDVPRHTYTERMARIRRRLSALETERHAIDIEAADYDARTRATLSLAERIEGIRTDLPTMPFEERRALLVALSVEVVVHAAPTRKEGHVIDIHNLLRPAMGLPVPRPPGRWRNQWGTQGDAPD